MRKSHIKEYLKEAIIILLKKQKIEDITVSDLITKAGVARASFYRNYSSIIEVVEEIIQDLLRSSCTNQMSMDSMVNDVYLIFNQIYQNKEIILILIRNNLEYSLYKEIYASAIKNINDLDVFNNYYQPHFFAGASSQLVIAWALNNFKETPEELTKIFFDFL